jgi:hypothetical protein
MKFPAMPRALGAVSCYTFRSVCFFGRVSQIATDKGALQCAAPFLGGRIVYMPPAAGTQTYAADQPPVMARGYLFTDAELDAMLAEDVRPIVHDEAGAAELGALLAGVATTEFANQALGEVLNSAHDPEPWRVGEAIAEAYLVEHRHCEFPWLGGRDLKNPESSPAGTDLVGFQTQPPPSSARFSFGEVKTSNHHEYPPSLMYGRHGLKQQLEGLRDDPAVKDALVRYLGLHSYGRPWLGRFRQAASRYIHDRSDVAIFGVLVRDVSPNPLDCSGRAARLAHECPALSAIELLALYLPADSIATLPARVPPPPAGGGQ